MTSVKGIGPSKPAAFVAVIRSVAVPAEVAVPLSTPELLSVNPLGMPVPVQVIGVLPTASNAKE